MRKTEKKQQHKIIHYSNLALANQMLPLYIHLAIIMKISQSNVATIHTLSHNHEINCHITCS